MKNKAISLITGDITKLKVDVIVNAANNSLLGGGGVDGAIHRAAGPKLLDACRTIGGCPTGEARITPGFNLPAHFVIHTVGPVWRGGNHNEEALLRACYIQSLKLGTENQCFTIAFPNISTGIYGFPRQRAAEIAIGAVQDFIRSSPSLINVVFVCFDDENYKIYRQLLDS
ncbi:MAG: O-acetyl-ADP-ribose deacetylase [Lentimicrobium sp.]|nr:O-acetyl-ADP-ribose deacetylase [Lentimicrobium sp.]